MGCGSSSEASAPGRQDAGDDINEGNRIVYDKKTGRGRVTDGGKDDDGREDDFFEVEEEKGEQFMAVLPWIGQVAEPDSHNPVNPDRPDTTYELEYVYGYRCADSRQNVHFNAAGQAVYMTAALGVILDPASNTQKFFGGGEVENTAKNVANDQNHHTDDIMCVKVCPARHKAASGQVGARPTVFTWDASTGEKINRIKVGKGARGIAAIDINLDGMICAVDLHNDHHVYVWDASGNMLFKEKGGQEKSLDIAWDKKPGSKRLAVSGRKHVEFWDAAQAGGGNKGGIFGNEGRPKTVPVITWCENGRCYSGDNVGKIWVWEQDGTYTKAVKTMKVHDGFISALKVVGSSLYSGAKDGKVNVIDIGSMSITNTVQISDQIIRAVDFHNGELIVGQRDGTISINTNGTNRDIMKSHHEGEVWGLDQTADGTVVTSGDDNKVMFWDPNTRCSTKVVAVSNKSRKAKRGGASTLSDLPDSQCSRSVAVNDQYLAVAANDGSITVRSLSSPGDVIKEMTDSSEWIEVMAFSPDNQWLAAGSHDNNIYIYRTSDWGLEGTCKAHNSYVMAFDWCTHSKYIRSNCGAYELLFFTIPDCQQDKNGRSNTTGVEWATKTCKFQWEAQGIYPKGTDGTHINSVAGSGDRQLLATGDDFGLVNLFRDPCRNGGLPRSLRGHSEHVVRVKFGAGDSKLFSIGGYDQTLMQWQRK